MGQFQRSITVSWLIYLVGLYRSIERGYVHIIQCLIVESNGESNTWHAVSVGPLFRLVAVSFIGSVCCFIHAEPSVSTLSIQKLSWWLPSPSIKADPGPGPGPGPGPAATLQFDLTSIGS